MKLKATIKYDSKYKLLPHTTKCPFSSNEIRRCFKHKYDFVTSRSTRYVRVNWSTQRKTSWSATLRVRLVNPTPLPEDWSPAWDEQDQRFWWKEPPKELQLSFVYTCVILYKFRVSCTFPASAVFLLPLPATECFTRLGTNDNIQQISDTIKSP